MVPGVESGVSDGRMRGSIMIWLVGLCLSVMRDGGRSLMGVGLKGSRVSAPYLVDIYN